MKTVKLIIKILFILLRIFAFLFFMWIGFWLLDHQSDLMCIVGFIIIIFDIVITGDYLIIKIKNSYLTFKQKTTNESIN